MFTIHSDPWKPLTAFQNSKFPREHLDFNILVRWIVPNKVKQELIKKLDFLAINTRTLFPDLDYLARGLVERDTLWHGMDPST